MSQPPYTKVAVGYAMALLLLFAMLVAFAPAKHHHDDLRQSMRSSFVR